jgi:hypothetical protein
VVLEKGEERVSTQGGQADGLSTGEQSYILRLAATASFETAAALSCLWRGNTRHQADRKRLEIGRVNEKCMRIYTRYIRTREQYSRRDMDEIR